MLYSKLSLASQSTIKVIDNVVRAVPFYFSFNSFDFLRVISCDVPKLVAPPLSGCQHKIRIALNCRSIIFQYYSR